MGLFGKLFGEDVGLTQAHKPEVSGSIPLPATILEALVCSASQRRQ